jgi:hypothetical protein
MIVRRTAILLRSSSGARHRKHIDGQSLPPTSRPITTRDEQWVNVGGKQIWPGLDPAASGARGFAALWCGIDTHRVSRTHGVQVHTARE